MYCFIKCRFQMGYLAVTYEVAEILTPDDIVPALKRHAEGEWGVDDHDWEMNDHAVEYGGRILSSHSSAAGEKFWIITEADRSVTTILFPHEY